MSKGTRVTWTEDGVSYRWPNGHKTRVTIGHVTDLLANPPRIVRIEHFDQADKLFSFTAWQIDPGKIRLLKHNGGMPRPMLWPCGG